MNAQEGNSSMSGSLHNGYVSGLLVTSQPQCFHCCYTRAPSSAHQSQLLPVVYINLHFFQVPLNAVFTAESLTASPLLPVHQFTIQCNFLTIESCPNNKYAQFIVLSLLLAQLLQLAGLLWEGLQCEGHCLSMSYA